MNKIKYYCYHIKEGGGNSMIMMKTAKMIKKIYLRS